MSFRDNCAEHSKDETIITTNKIGILKTIFPVIICISIFSQIFLFDDKHLQRVSIFWLRFYSEAIVEIKFTFSFSSSLYVCLLFQPFLHTRYICFEVCFYFMFVWGGSGGLRDTREWEGGIQASL